MFKKNLTNKILILSYFIMLIATFLLAQYYSNKFSGIDNSISKNVDIPTATGSGRFRHLFNDEQIDNSISKSRVVPNLFEGEQPKRFKIISGGLKSNSQLPITIKRRHISSLTAPKESVITISLISFLILVVIGISYLLLLAVRNRIKIAGFIKKTFMLVKNPPNNLLICIGIFISIISFPHIKQRSYIGFTGKSYIYTNNDAVFFTAIGAILIVFGALRKIDELKNKK